jgi:hypothetical protein
MPSVELEKEIYKNVITSNSFQYYNDNFSNGYQEPSPIKENNTDRNTYKQIIDKNIWENIADY